jgi:cytoskeletal protein CcmA (bactofilin family)
MLKQAIIERSDAVTHTHAEHDIASVIGGAATVVGDLTTEGQIEVEGIVEGTVRGRRVTVEEGGLVEGEIVAVSVCIRGSVKGPVTADSVAVTRTARVIGNITHNELSIEPGAYLDGRRPWRLRPLEDRDKL